jgi:predicted esterase
VGQSNDRRITVIAARQTLMAGCLLAATCTLRAGEVKLKNGLVLRGTPIPVETLYTGPRKPRRNEEIKSYPILMVSSPVRRYFVPARQRAAVDDGVDLGRNEVFRLKVAKMSGGSRELQMVGDFAQSPEMFDEFGRRTVRLHSATGELTVIQAISEIGPDHVKISALNYKWETAMPTSSVPVERLDAMLRRATRANNPDDRLQIARFYIQARRYAHAQRELDAIKQQFPELADTVSQVMVNLTQVWAQEIVDELKLRLAAGQHAYVEEKCRAFPVENVAPSILREVRELMARFEMAEQRIRTARELLHDLQARLENDPRVEDVAPLRADLTDRLDTTNIDRLEAFLKLASDAQLGPDEKLALALSGYVVGSDQAVTSLDQALRLWHARLLVLDYLRSARDDAAGRNAILEELDRLEGVGPERVAQLIPLLPPPLEPSGLETGLPARIDVTGNANEAPVAYWVLLPHEYDPQRRYPAILALHGAGHAPGRELEFWGGTAQRPGQSQRHGYIVIAPEYAAAEEHHYDYAAGTRKVVIEALRDACRRFAIDCDRVFLSGHGMGGDAAFDMGFSHPDLFAGVIPIGGVSDQQCQFLWENARQLPFFVILGELDRDTVARNTRELERMMKQNMDVVYAEYVGSGPDSFTGEIHVLFDWMSRIRRPRAPRQIEMKSLRSKENRYYWLEVDGLPDKREPPRPVNLSATFFPPGNKIAVTHGGTRTRLWLAADDGFVDFSKRLTVTINGKARWNNFLKPDLEVLLDHARVHGDRQLLYWAMLEF